MLLCHVDQSLQNFVCWLFSHILTNWHYDLWSPRSTLTSKVKSNISSPSSLYTIFNINSKLFPQWLLVRDEHSFLETTFDLWGQLWPLRPDWTFQTSTTWNYSIYLVNFFSLMSFGQICFLLEWSLTSYGWRVGLVLYFNSQFLMSLFVVMKIF